MDPLSILGALAASSQIAQQSYDAIKFLNDIKTQMKDGPKNISRQIQQIEQFITLLALVIKNTTLQTPEIYSVVKTCLHSAKDLKDCLGSHLATPEDGKWKKWRKAFAGVRAEKKMSSMLADLEREKSLLNLNIQKIDLSLLQTVELHAKDIKSTVGAVAKDLTNVKSILLSMNSRSDHMAPTERTNKNYFIVPNRRVGGFIGREDILDRIEKGLSSESGSRVVVLRGLGGQGKTQIALEYCHRSRKNNIQTIFWVDATSENTIKKDFEAISGLIRKSTDSSRDNQEVTLVLDKLRDWDEPWLMVFDNHDHPSSFHLPEFMPSGQYGRILITSRHADTAALAEPDNYIELSGLPKDDACNLLIRQSRLGDAASRNDAYTIVNRLGYHALAITQARSYIQTQKIKLSQFMDSYNQQREAILQETPRMSQYRRKIGEAADETALNVFTTWELSYQQLEKIDDEKNYKARVLTLFAFFDCQNISQSLFETYCTKEKFFLTNVSKIEEASFLFSDEYKKWDQQKFVDTLNELSQLSLIQSWYRDENGQCHLSLHPLVQDWIRLRASSQLCYDLATLSAYILAMVLKQSYSDREFTMPLSLRQEILAHLNLHGENQVLMATLKKEKVFSKNMIYHLDVYYWFTYFYRDCGFYQESEMIARRWVKASVQEYGQEDDRTVEALVNLSDALDQQKKLDEAFDIDQRALNIYKRKYGPEHQSVLTATHNLAWNLRKRKELVKAEELFRQVIEIEERVLGHEHVETLSSIHGLSRVRLEMGNLADAEVLYRSLVKNSQRILGVSHQNSIYYTLGLATVLKYQGRYSEALPYYKDAYTQRLAIFGPESPLTLEYKRFYMGIRQKLKQQLQSEEIKRETTSSASQSSDCQTNVQSECSESDK